MKLEVGKWYKARNGLKAFVKDVEYISPTLTMTGIEIANVIYSDKSIRRVYKRNGKVVDNFLGFESSYDLIEELKDETSTTSPIREKTIKELVPGVYGCVTVGAGYTGELRYSVSPFMTVDQLRAAAKTFIEIADYLDEQK